VIIMSLEELISIERVELYSTKERIQETYAVSFLLLSKLFKEISIEVKKDILPLLDIKLLLQVLRDVPFVNEAEGVVFLENLNNCLENELYGISGEWACKVIKSQVEKLKDLVLYDYVIEGSFTVYLLGKIKWDLYVSLL